MIRTQKLRAIWKAISPCDRATVDGGKMICITGVLAKAAGVTSHTNHYISRLSKEQVDAMYSVVSKDTK